MHDVLFTLGNRAYTLGDLVPFALIAGGIIALLVVILMVQARSARRKRDAELRQQNETLESRLQNMIASQAELTGRMQTMAEIFSERQSDLNRALSERLDGMSHKMNQSVGEATKTTQEKLQKLHERLAVLDAAQNSITDLTGQVTTLSNILGNKQTRGAFGQGRMEAIIADGLPQGAYAMQATLTTGVRPDCLIFMPNESPPLVVDAKFPLEGFNAMKAAAGPDEVKSARTQFRNDVIKHVKDIKDRYLIPGETQDTAFMFVPSETVFAEIHEHFDDVIQRAHRARVVIVSPSLLMLSVQVIQAVLKDARLREQAHIIHDEVMKLIGDVGRLDERVDKLAGHFAMAQKDLDQIKISSDKVKKGGTRIENLGLGGETAETPKPRLIGGGGGS